MEKQIITKISKWKKKKYDVNSCMLRIFNIKKNIYLVIYITDTFINEIIH